MFERDAIRAHLRQAGIGTLIHYPVPAHLHPAYHDCLPRLAPLPLTEKVAQQILSLPIFPQMNEDQASCVNHEVSRFLKTNKGVEV